MVKLWILPLLLLPAIAGCGPKNPSFDLSENQAQRALREMARDPKPLQRPLIIVAGYGDPGFADAHLRKKIGPCLDDDRIARMSFSDARTFDDCRRQLIEHVDERFPGGDAAATVEVDMVANSMGGVIARYAADPTVGDRYLRVARLFTISAPHRGAEMAELPTSNELLIDMRPGSEFLEGLNERSRDPSYELIPYARVGDSMVGEENTAPPGQVAWWVPNRAFEPAHLTAFGDPRIIADILRRLRDEPPYTTEPRAPWPSSGGEAANAEE
ncbi:MAG: esterase/lipase family protein [Planctomycetota bacterium]